MFAKIVNGKVSVYPYSAGDMRRDNPNTSFPQVMSKELLEAFGVYPVSQLEIPSDFDNINQNYTPAAPTLVDGTWVQDWDISSAYPEEVAQRLADLAQNARATRNELLVSSDWTQLPDAPVDRLAWAEYRSSLRDMTTQSSFPLNIVWPIKP